MSVIKLSDVRLFLKTYRLAHALMDCYYRKMQGITKALRPLPQVSSCAVLGGYDQTLEVCLQDCLRVHQKAVHAHDYAFLVQDQINTYEFLREQHLKMQCCLDSINPRYFQDTLQIINGLQSFKAALKSAIARTHRVYTSLKALEGCLAQIPPSLFKKILSFPIGKTTALCISKLAM